MQRDMIGVFVICSHLMSTQKRLQLTHHPQRTCKIKKMMKISSGNSLKTQFKISDLHLHTLTQRAFTSESAGHRRPCLRPTLSTDRIRLDQNMPFKQAGSETHTHSGIHTQQSPAQALTLGAISMTGAP